MPIVALQQATISAIGSASALPDLYSVVKELIENGLDSGATSISVEISSNTIDSIQVRDNGSGIPPEDREFACRRNYTSKIQTLEDLRQIGGASLGFRGQALASIAETSGSLAITTRVGEEQVASEMKFDRRGELLRQVFFQRGKIYGVNWIYSPNSPPSYNDAILKVAGAAVAATCTEISLSSTDKAEDVVKLSGSIGPNQMHHSGIRLSAALPKWDADFSKLNHKEQYVSIDGRPMKTTRGIGKAITQLLKQRLRCLPGRETASVTDPFFCISLSCPPGIYDVNIEPGKDDVQFEDRHYILSLVGVLLKRAYGEVLAGGQDETHETALSNQDSWSAKADDSTVLQTKTAGIPVVENLTWPQESSATSHLNSQRGRPSTPPLGCLPTPRKPRVAQNPGRASCIHRHGTTRQVSHHARAANPWEIAKLCAKQRCTRDPYSQLLTPRRETSKSFTGFIASSQGASDEMAPPVMHHSQDSPFPHQSAGTAAARRKPDGAHSLEMPPSVQSGTHTNPLLARKMYAHKPTAGTDNEELSEGGSFMQAIEDRFGTSPEAYPVQLSMNAVPVRSPPQFNIIELSSCAQTTNLDHSVPDSNLTARLGHQRQQQCRKADSGNQANVQPEIRLGQVQQLRTSCSGDVSLPGNVIGCGRQTPSTQFCKNGNSAIVPSKNPERAISPGSEIDPTAPGSLDLCSTLTHNFRRKDDTRHCPIGENGPNVSQSHPPKLSIDVVASKTCRSSVVVRATVGEFTSSLHQLIATDSYIKSGNLFLANPFYVAETCATKLMKSKALELAVKKYRPQLSGIVTTPHPFSEAQEI